MLHLLKKLNYFLVATRSRTGKNNVFFFGNRDSQNSRLFSQEKWWFVVEICLIWMLMEYANDNSPHFRINFYN